jgi:hypothetical protein
MEQIFLNIVDFCQVLDTNHETPVDDKDGTAVALSADDSQRLHKAFRKKLSLYLRQP